MEEQKTKSSTGLQSNVGGLLCYLVGWITGLIFFLIEKEDPFVRFHAMQSIITFASLSVLSIVAGVIPIIGWIIAVLIWPLSLVLWILLMIKAYQGERFKLPVVGELAEKYI
ncbi:MAG TPA: hypothetical protein DCW86_04405 [Actinobacteria bacterium]|nr:hypothetical protein [Actinomycetota bacterium]